MIAEFLEHERRVHTYLTELAIQVINGDYDEKRRKEDLKTVKGYSSVRIDDVEYVVFISDDTWGNVSGYRIPREILKGDVSIEEYWRVLWENEAPQRREREYYREIAERNELERIEKRRKELIEKLNGR